MGVIVLTNRQLFAIKVVLALGLLAIFAGSVFVVLEPVLSDKTDACQEAQKTQRAYDMLQGDAWRWNAQLEGMRTTSLNWLADEFWSDGRALWWRTPGGKDMRQQLANALNGAAGQMNHLETQLQGIGLRITADVDKHCTD